MDFPHICGGSSRKWSFGFLFCEPSSLRAIIEETIESFDSIVLRDFENIFSKLNRNMSYAGVDKHITSYKRCIGINCGSGIIRQSYNKSTRLSTIESGTRSTAGDNMLGSSERKRSQNRYIQESARIAALTG
eukprot:SAG11_NODE_527_length_8731_cov_3.883457_5_plen_132_part_00